MTTASSSKGISLIEVMVVVFIIGLLAAIVSVSLTLARQRARDGRRIADVQQVRIALEQFFQSRPFKQYPEISFGGFNGYCALTTQLAPFLPILPRDPLDTGAGCGAPSGYAYYADQNLNPQEWLLRVNTLERPYGVKNALAEDLDGAQSPANGGDWTGGVNAAAVAASVDCGSASNDAIYCVRAY